jgi:hypothetical protein
MIGHNKPPRAEWESNPSGWIAVSREMRSHPIVGAGKPVAPSDGARGAHSRMEAWVDLLCLAQYKPTRAPNRGRVMTLDAGQLVGSQRWLAERWNWTHKTVRHFLEVLVDEGMISFGDEVTHKAEGTQTRQYNNIQAGVITVCNYSNYQLHKELITEHVKRAKGHTRGTLGAHKGGTQRGTEPSAEEQAIAVACADGWAAGGPQRGTLPTPDRGTILTSNNLSEERKNNNCLSNHAAREPAPDRQAVALKEVFNGSTDSMLTDAAKWMGLEPGSPYAAKWLQSTLTACGADATARAYAALCEKQARNEPIANPITWWAKTATTMKANAPKPKSSIDERNQHNEERRRRYMELRGLKSRDGEIL